MRISKGKRPSILEQLKIITPMFKTSIFFLSCNKPSLLIRGKYDPITCEVQTTEFMNRVSDKEVITFDFSSHWVRIEEPDKYCEVITSYIYKKMKQ